MTIQEQFDQCTQEVFSLPAGEYEGPLRIHRSCIVDGQGATLWAAAGPVLCADVPGIVVKNLRVEITGRNLSAADRVTIRSAAGDTVLEHVAVNGSLEGFPRENANWQLPAIIPLGEFAAEAENVFSLQIVAGAPATIMSTITGISLQPQEVQAGTTQLLLRTEELKDGTTLYGEIFLDSIVRRRIYVTGRAKNGAQCHQEGELLYGASQRPDAADSSDAARLAQTAVPPVSVLCPDPVGAGAAVKLLQRGQRAELPEGADEELYILLTYANASRAADLDVYAFCLGADHKVRGDTGLVFFGNHESDDHAVKVSVEENRPLAAVSLGSVSAETERIALCYAIYEGNPRMDFSELGEPVVHIYRGRQEIYRYAMEGLSQEKSILALELYRYQGIWKLKIVGAGYVDGIRKLCEDYGVEVED